MPGSLLRGHRRRDGQGTNAEENFTGTAHTPLGLVQAVPSGNAGSRALCPHRGAQEAGGLIPAPFIPPPVLRGSAFNPELMASCSLSQTTDEKPGWPDTCGFQAAGAVA